MLTSRSSVRSRGQWSLVGTLVAVAVLVILAALYLPRLLKSKSPSGQEATAIQRADTTACTLYVSQLNQSVQMYKQDHDGQPPHSLGDLKKYGATDDMLNSPGCSFQMDPATGAVTNGPAPGAPPTVISPPAAPGVTPPPNGGTRGPGGITIPNVNPGGSGL